MMTIHSEDGRSSVRFSDLGPIGLMDSIPEDGPPEYAETDVNENYDQNTMVTRLSISDNERMTVTGGAGYRDTRTPANGSALLPRESKQENCCLRCFDCLARVPCATLGAWVFMLVGVCTCAGGLIVGTQRARDMIGKSDDFLQLTNLICIGVIFGMVFMGTLFLLTSVMSTGKTSKQIFNSHKKNICGRILNVFGIFFMLILQVAWILVASLLTLPLWLLGIFHVLYHWYDVESINLKHYGLSNTDHNYNLADLEVKTTDTVICYSVAYAGAVLAAISMTWFIIFGSSNYIYLQEVRPYSGYRNGMANSKDSVNHEDTRM